MGNKAKKKERACKMVCGNRPLGLWLGFLGVWRYVCWLVLRDGCISGGPPMHDERTTKIKRFSALASSWARFTGLLPSLFTGFLIEPFCPGSDGLTLL